jgi:Zn finger protein HypA/HybF involved in hydrogenase expression
MQARVHELSLVAELVEECRRRAGETPVSAVKVRWSSPEDDDEIRQAFAVLTEATALDGATLEIEQVPMIADCACGYRGRATSDDVVGHIFVCPRCAAVGPITSPALELVEIRLATVR